MRARVAAFLLACLVPLGAASAAALPLDLSPAPAAPESGYLSDREYQDETLHVWIEDLQRDDSVYHVAHVEVADASQLRTALSGSPGEKGKAEPSDMARANNAVLAINGDSYLYRSRGYVVRQGVTLRKSMTTDLDLLLIDTAGDFHALRKPTRNTIRAALAATDVAQCLAFGPVLVQDGQVQTVYNTYGFSPQDHSPRTAIGQTGPLSYVFVVVDGRQDSSRVAAQGRSPARLAASSSAAQLTGQSAAQPGKMPATGRIMPQATSPTTAAQEAMPAATPRSTIRVPANASRPPTANSHSRVKVLK